MTSSKVRRTRSGSGIGTGIGTGIGSGRVGSAIVFGACAALVAGCANGFGAPTRHALANLQAAHATVGATLQVQGLIIALPNGNSEPKGGTAYLMFTAINTANEPEELIDATVRPVSTPASASSSAGATGIASAAGSIEPDGATTIPRKAPSAPGVATLRVTLGDLTAPLSQGQSLLVSLSFKNSGSVSNLFVPVQGAAAVGSSFLPSAPGSGAGSPSGVGSSASPTPTPTATTLS